QAARRSRAQAAALHGAALLHRRALHRPTRSVREGRRYRSFGARDTRRQARRPPRAGLLHGRHRRGRPEEGGGDGQVVPLHLEVITPEGKTFEEDVDMVIAPGSEGYLGILPHHMPLLTALGPGEFRVKEGGTERTLAVFGGFMDVRPDRVVVLTDA